MKCNMQHCLVQTGNASSLRNRWAWEPEGAREETVLLTYNRSKPLLKHCMLSSSGEQGFSSTIIKDRPSNDHKFFIRNNYYIFHVKARFLLMLSNRNYYRMRVQYNVEEHSCPLSPLNGNSTLRSRLINNRLGHYWISRAR